MRMRVLCVALWLLCVGAPATAATISFVPGSFSGNVGDSFFFDIRLDGLAPGEGVSGFDLDVVFDAGILSLDNVAFGEALGALDTEQLTSTIVSPGRIDLASVSLLSEATLLALQPGDVILARITFAAIGGGTSPVVFDDVAAPGLLLLAADGLSELIITDISNASAKINSVPEPMTSILLIGGAAALLARSEKRGRVKAMPRRMSSSSH